MNTKILYVEDEILLGRIVKESLESRGFQIKMLETGVRILDEVAAFQPDICVLDVMLPDIDGFTLGKTIRKGHPNLPILFLTAKTQTEDLLKGFQSGGNDYIKKPFSMEELIVRINNLLSLSQSAAPSLPEDEIPIGNYTFFPSRFELAAPDASLRVLSHRETQLLEIFLEYQNRAVERKHILNTVWGDDSFFNSRNLDVYIKKLRSYLENDDQVKIITLKGYGYHFSVGQ